MPPKYLFAPTVPVSAPVVGREARFPLRRIYGLVRNHRRHAREMGGAELAPPTVFLKPSDPAAVVVLEAGEEGVVRYPRLTGRLHPEIELVVAIGVAGADIRRDAALDHVFGYAVGLDMTRQDLLDAASAQGFAWCVGKSFEDAAVLGPITPAAQAGGVHDAEFRLRVNGEARQRGRVSELTWGVAETIEQLSKSWALQPGDLIYMGTCDGVGPVVVGDRLEGSVEGLEALRARVVAHSTLKSEPGRWMERGENMPTTRDEAGETFRYLCEDLTRPLPVYAHATVYHGVGHVSGVQGFKPGTYEFPERVEDEVDQMMVNLGKILAGIGSDFRSLLKMNLFFTNIDRDFAAANEVVNRYIPDHSPARSSIGVAALPRNARVVVDCVAVAAPPKGPAAKDANGYDIALINDLSDERFDRKFAAISSSKTWRAEMKRRRPFATAEKLLDDASDVWWNRCSREDWIESFSGRPVIGDLESFVKDKWCYLEDEHVIEAGPEVAAELIRCNAPYMEKFGFIWILLCEGLTPEQQLANYKRRVENDPRTELVENCVEEFKIIQRRLRLCLLNQDPYDVP